MAQLILFLTFSLSITGVIGLRLTKMEIKAYIRKVYKV